jgi:dCTP deaminase
MLLSYLELVELVEQGVIDAPKEQINGASIDLTLDDQILVEKFQTNDPVVRLFDKQAPDMVPLSMTDEGFYLRPGQFILANTRETFFLPNTIACTFKLKSSIARGGLNHLLAGFADPCWTNSRLTLELKNDLQYHTLLLKKGMKIGQMVFYRVTPVPHESSYAVKGRYNDTLTVTASKGV